MRLAIGRRQPQSLSRVDYELVPAGAQFRDIDRLILQL